MLTRYPGRVRSTDRRHRLANPNTRAPLPISRQTSPSQSCSSSRHVSLDHISDGFFFSESASSHRLYPILAWRFGGFPLASLSAAATCRIAVAFLSGVHLLTRRTKVCHFEVFQFEQGDRHASQRFAIVLEALRAMAHAHLQHLQDLSGFHSIIPLDFMKSRISTAITTS